VVSKKKGGVGKRATPSCKKNQKSKRLHEGRKSPLARSERSGKHAAYHFKKKKRDIGKGKKKCRALEKLP